MIPPIAEILSRFRPLGFGTLLGAGLAGLIYIFVNSRLPQEVTYHVFLTTGAFLGAGFHRLISSAYNAIFCGPLAQDTNHFMTLAEIFLVRKVIGQEKLQRLVSILTLQKVIRKNIKLKTLVELNKENTTPLLGNESMLAISEEITTDVKKALYTSLELRAIENHTQKGLLERFEKRLDEFEELVEKSTPNLKEGDKKSSQKSK